MGRKQFLDALGCSFFQFDLMAQMMVIMEECIARLQDVEGLRIKKNERLCRYTSFGIGGNCMGLIEVETVEAIKSFKKILNKHEPKPGCFVMGGGSNLLVSDKGYEGFVLRLGRGFSFIEKRGDELWVGSATPLALLVSQAVKNGWDGIDRLIGVPGNVGGAIRMNAGTRDGETWDLVSKIEGVNERGEEEVLYREEVQPGYRNGRLPKGFVVTGAFFQFKPTDPELLRKKKESSSKRRDETQPLGSSTCGCAFKNPVGDSAGRLIEAAGLKGYRVGGAVISDIHANFILNEKGEATAEDVLNLMKLIRNTVHDKFKIKLEPEVTFVGFNYEDVRFFD